MLEQENLIILRTIRYGDSDLIVHALNKNGDQLHLIAKAALRSKKRFGGGVLEPTHFVSASFSKTKNYHESSLYILKEASLIEDFPELRLDLARLNFALYLLKMTSKFSMEGTTDSEQIFNLLGNSLKAATKTKSLDLLKTHFELKLLNQHGILPPELNQTEWLNTPIHKHEKIAPSSSTYQNLKMMIDTVLKSNDLNIHLTSLA